MLNKRTHMNFTVVSHGMVSVIQKIVSLFCLFMDIKGKINLVEDTYIGVISQN